MPRKGLESPVEYSYRIQNSLEPVYGNAGGTAEWVRWFYDITFRSPSLCFGYAQVGQENSFGWPAMAAGLTDQLAFFAAKAKAGEIRIETLAVSGAWFRDAYTLTPSAAITALSDWQDQGRRTVWYYSRYYRANLLWNRGCLRFRDLHKFDENYAERYLEKVCATADCLYDTLPVCEGFLWSDPTTTAGIHFCRRQPDGTVVSLSGADPEVRESGEEVLTVRWPIAGSDDVNIAFSPEDIAICGPAEDWFLEFRWAPSAKPPIAEVGMDFLAYTHEGTSYRVVCESGRCERLTDAIRIAPADGRIRLRFT